MSRKYKPDRRHPEKIASVRWMLTHAISVDPDHVAFMYKNGTEIVSVTNTAFLEDVESLGTALAARGFGDAHVACVGENSYPWINTFLSVLMSEGVFVPLDKELPADDLIRLINESDSTLVFCGPKQEKHFRLRRGEMPAVKLFVCFGNVQDDGDFISFAGLLEAGRTLPRDRYDAMQSDPNALKYLVYTSGTTGAAKGVMLSEHNIISGIYNGMLVSQIYDRCLSVLPYNHTYEAVCDILVSIHSHSTLCINDSLRHVQENLRLFKPDYIYLVPAFSEHFYDGIWNGIRKSGREKQFRSLLQFSDNLRKIGIDLRRTFFSAILAQFGGKLKKIVCGGAPIREDIGRFFDSIGISMTGGYGITECSPLVSVNDDRDNNYSSAGHRIPCLEWQIENPDEDGIGEILVKGDVVMLGYYKRPDLTAEAIRDGWFHTGDYGYINALDEIVLTGRKKNIIVLNNGKNVYPEELEEKLHAIRYVTEVVVSGVKNEYGQNVALRAEVYAEDRNADTSHLLEDIRICMAGQPSYKRITQACLRDTPFEKTTTNKILRK